MYRSADLQDASSHALMKIKGLIQPTIKEAYAASNKTGKQLYKAYPALAHNVRDAAYQTAKHSHKALKAAGDQFGTTAHTFGKQIHCVEKSLLKMGFLCVAYKLFVSNKEVINAKDKVKTHIHEKPLESAIIALGAGYILGKIFR